MIDVVEWCGWCCQLAIGKDCVLAKVVLIRSGWSGVCSGSGWRAKCFCVDRGHTVIFSISNTCNKQHEKEIFRRTFFRSYNSYFYSAHLFKHYQSIGLNESFPPIYTFMGF